MSFRSPRPRSGVPLVAPIVALILASGAGVLLAAADPPPHELRFPSFNRVYSDLVGELAPLDLGGATVRLRSPSQLISVRDHVARVVPLGGGRARGTLDIDLLGKGALVADVDFGGTVRELTDELILPPQHVSVDGVVRILRSRGGYRVIAEKAPATVPIEIRSRLVNQIESLCDGASLISLGALDCSPLARSLEHPDVPLPAQGHEFFLADGELTPAERGQLDALIAAPTP
jgi:hypothetical protein